METINIPLHKILNNKNYRFTSSSDVYLLENSIKQSGILQPIHVIEQKTGYCILSGFRRVDIARKLNLTSIPAYMVEANRIPEGFLAGLSEHLSTRSLNIIEKSRILNIVDHFSNISEDVNQGVYQLLELNKHSKKNQLHLDLLQLHSDLIAYIETYDTSLKQAAAFLTFSSEEQSLFVQLAKTLNIRIVELDAIAQLFFQISKRDQLSIQAVYDQLEIVSLLKNDTLTRSQKIQQIKNVLIEKRFPKVSQWQFEIQQAIKSLSLPFNTDILWDKNLEAPGITLRSNLKNNDDWVMLQKIVNDSTNFDVLQKIFKILG